MPDLPRALQKSVADNRLVPFVGAGVSNAVRKKDGGQALPTWLELLRRGASELRDDGKSDVADVVETMVRALAGPNTKGMDPVGLAGTIRSNLAGNKWVEFLEDNLTLDSESIDEASLELPKEIWNLANNFVVTTNFDKVLNWTCPRSKDARNLDLDDCAGLADTLKGSFRYPTIWHLHGYIDNPSKLILTRDEYDQLYGSQKSDSHPYSAALLTLKSVFASRTILFVGFSFADDYVRQQLEWLASAFSGYNGEHFALVHRAEMDRASALLTKLQVRPIPFDDFGPPLINLIRAIAAFKPTEKGLKQVEKEPSLAETVSPANAQPIPIDERWRATRAVRLMDQLGPTYILDPSYFFMDWNPAFEKLFAEPLGLYRGQHAQEFVRSLVNRGVVESRARQVFLPGKIPSVDMEPLFFRSEEFGVIELWKIASRIVDDEGDLAAWSVALNILSCEKMEALWAELKRVLDQRVNWALYAPSYDKLLLNFDEYGELIRFVCSKLDGATHCADLGAGTGNGTLELLRQRADRIVWAIEPSEDMLSKLRSKIGKSGKSGSDLSGRVHLMRQSLRSLGEFDDAYFDGAIMINVLYAVDQPLESLTEVGRIMRPGGVLVLSTPHSETNVDRLFDAIRQNFTKKGRIAEFRPVIDEVRKRHDQMMNKIHRDTKADIRNYLEQAGFAIEEWFDDMYCGAVVVVKAVRTDAPYDYRRDPEIDWSQQAVQESKAEPVESKRDLIFVSYSHKDEAWLFRLNTMLAPLVRAKAISVWSDKNIRTGQRWKAEIESALSRAAIAILLVSDNFLASDFITENELPPLLKKAEKGGLQIVWIPVSSCLYRETPISEYQAASPPDRPLDRLTEAESKAELARICGEIRKIGT